MASHKQVHDDTKTEQEDSPYNANPEKGTPSQSIEASEIGLRDTTNDISDMRRLGKKQEFKVKSPWIHIQM